MFFFSAFFLLFTSCASQTVINIPRLQAEKLLSEGDITFILEGPLKKTAQTARIDPSAPFYAGLLVSEYQRKNSEDENANGKAEILFKTALKSPITAAAAANKLIPQDPDFYFDEYKNKTETGIDLSNAGSEWEAAFSLLKEYKEKKTPEITKKKLHDYFFTGQWNSGGKRVVEEWLWSRIKESEDFEENPPLTARESDALRGRFAVALRDYGEAYRCFLSMLKEPGGAEEGGFSFEKYAAGFFIEYNAALNDFGRAIQYGGVVNNGVKLFLEYDGLIKEASKNEALDAEKAKQARYLLNYYLGRFYRAGKKYDKGEEAFLQALETAPDALQKDACIWYIIDMRYAQKPEKALAYIKNYAPKWNDKAYFDDILDKIAFYFSGKNKWQNLLDVYPAVKAYASESSQAKYAYIIARALEEGYLKTKMENITVNGLFEAAYNQESDYYYRAMAASKLKKDPAVVKLYDEDESLDESEMTANSMFLSGFFRFGSARFALTYINLLYDGLSMKELRHLAKKLSEAGRYGDAIRLVVKYSKREDFKLTRMDMELSYPRAFKDIVERYAQKTGMEENYLYALMRTESIFIPDIVSRSGALGLTQLMPATGRQMAEILAREGGPNYIEDGEIDLLEPERNVHLGALYYKDMEMRMGGAQSALMAYNGGIGRVRRWKRVKKNMPDDLFAETIEIAETREYSKKVIADAFVYQFLYY
jgi:soluble lytic murein transglycosylase